MKGADSLNLLHGQFICNPLKKNIYNFFKREGDIYRHEIFQMKQQW